MRYRLAEDEEAREERVNTARMADGRAACQTSACSLWRLESGAVWQRGESAARVCRRVRVRGW